MRRKPIEIAAAEAQRGSGPSKNADFRGCTTLASRAAVRPRDRAAGARAGPHRLKSTEIAHQTSGEQTRDARSDARVALRRGRLPWRARAAELRFQENGGARRRVYLFISHLAGNGRGGRPFSQPEADVMVDHWRVTGQPLNDLVA